MNVYYMEKEKVFGSISGWEMMALFSSKFLNPTLCLRCYLAKQGRKQKIPPFLSILWETDGFEILVTIESGGKISSLSICFNTTIINYIISKGQNVLPEKYQLKYKKKPWLLTNINQQYLVPWYYQPGALDSKVCVTMQYSQSI